MGGRILSERTAEFFGMRTPMETCRQVADRPESHQLSRPLALLKPLVPKDGVSLKVKELSWRMFCE